MNATTAERLVRDIDRLVALPDVCVRLQELVADPRSSAADIGRVIGQDADLSGRLLRLANSAWYGHAGRVDTVARAVTLLGTRELVDLALATASCDLFRGIPEELFNMTDFWHYAVVTGAMARTMARPAGVLEPERLFLIGVLHDIGRLVILQHLTSQAREILLLAQGRNELLQQAERDVLGFDHAEIGYELMRRWGLPAAIQTCVHFHHQPFEAVEYRLECALIHIAQVLARDLIWGDNDSAVAEALDPGLWALTGLAPEWSWATPPPTGAQVMELFGLLMGDHRRSRSC